MEARALLDTWRWSTEPRSAGVNAGNALEDSLGRSEDCRYVSPRFAAWRGGADADKRLRRDAGERDCWRAGLTLDAMWEW